jgi:hypothetical protein
VELLVAGRPRTLLLVVEEEEEEVAVPDLD